MIRILKGEALSESDVLGKYVLRELPFHWLAFGKARIVTSVVGSRAYLAQERAVQADDGRTMRLTGEGERTPDGYTTLTAIRCICDTPEEVHAVLASSEAANREFRAMLDGAKKRLADLDGTAIGEVRHPAP